MFRVSSPVSQTHTWYGPNISIGLTPFSSLLFRSNFFIHALMNFYCNCSAPTGRHGIAQRIALGTITMRPQALKGRDKRREYFALSGLGDFLPSTQRVALGCHSTPLRD